MTNKAVTALSDARSYITRWIVTVLLASLVLPAAAVAVFCISLPNDNLHAFGAATIVFIASNLAGGLLGFIFGIPRAARRGAEVGDIQERRRLSANTNLEEVSDWLTKIIVGATLVQIGNIARRFGELTSSISTIFGAPSAENKAVVAGIILYAAIHGFLVYYSAARSLLTFLFYISPSDWIPEQQDINGSSGSSDRS